MRQLEGGQPVRFAGVGYAVDDRPDAGGGEGDPEVVEGGAAAHGQVPAVGVRGRHRRSPPVRQARSYWTTITSWGAVALPPSLLR